MGSSSPRQRPLRSISGAIRKKVSPRPAYVLESTVSLPRPDQNPTSATSLAAESHSPSRVRSRSTSARTTATSPSSARIAIGHSRSRRTYPSMYVRALSRPTGDTDPPSSCARIQERARTRAQSPGAISRSRGRTNWRGTKTCIGRRAWTRSSSPDRIHAQRDFREGDKLYAPLRVPLVCCHAVVTSLCCSIPTIQLSLIMYTAVVHRHRGTEEPHVQYQICTYT